MFTDGKSRNTGGDFSHSGKWLAYQSTRRNGKDNDIWVVDPADPKTERKVLEVSGGGWGVSDWSPDDKTLLVGEYLSANESRLLARRRGDGREDARRRPSRRRRSRGAAPSSRRTGRSLYATTDSGSEFHRLVSLDVASRKIDRPDARSRLGREPRSASPTTGRSSRSSSTRAASRRSTSLDTATRKEIALPKIPLGTIGARPLSTRTGRTSPSRSRRRGPPSDVYSIDVTAGDGEGRALDGERDWADSTRRRSSEPETISWKSFDGRTITGFLYRPPASFAGPRPVDRQHPRRARKGSTSRASSAGTTSS